MWAQWEPTYRRILQDFGYSAAADLEERDLLHALTTRATWIDGSELRAALEGREVIVAGPRPTELPPGPVIATDAASWAFDRATAIVTDLDGDVEAQVQANARGVPLFLHAHGDNIATLRKHAQRFIGPLQPTTQAAPRDHVLDVGGFTDGDRACCLAAELGARSLVLAGFDFDTPWPKPGADPSIKRRKLAWARTIIDSLGIPYRVVR